jgi:hypothetical protein
MKDAALPITLIVVGALWLAWHFGWFPDVDWIVAAGLVLGGIAIIAVDGFTKSSVVVGPFMIAAGIAWAVHDRRNLTWSVLIPALLIVLGVLMLIARHPSIPMSRARRDGSEPPAP